jgi:trans-L-3-hydroxyproline dehydratase
VQQITTVEMHTGGEPVRIITAGFPPVLGDTLLAKRRHVHAKLDHLRRMLMAEPRGHADMYGALLVEPDAPDADLAVLFLHNEGYSTMCGHAVIALGRFAVDRKLVAAREPETTVRIQCPCGLVTASVEVQGRRAGRVRFTSVPAFAYARDAVVVTEVFGPVILDVAYGGAFYGILPASQLGLDLQHSPLARIVEAALQIKAAAMEQLALAHPTEPDLAYLYGIILTDDMSPEGRGPTANICVFAAGQVDRSPTGSGVTARLALMHRRRQVDIGESRAFSSITGTEFTGRVIAETTVGPHPAVLVEVTGEAFYTGEASFTCEPEDPLGGGFLLRR